jgi:hypothetical protein
VHRQGLAAFPRELARRDTSLRGKESERQRVRIVRECSPLAMMGKTFGLRSTTKMIVLL